MGPQEVVIDQKWSLGEEQLLRFMGGGEVEIPLPPSAHEGRRQPGRQAQMEGAESPVGGGVSETQTDWGCRRPRGSRRNPPFRPPAAPQPLPIPSPAPGLWLEDWLQHTELLGSCPTGVGLQRGSRGSSLAQTSHPGSPVTCACACTAQPVLGP